MQTTLEQAARWVAEARGLCWPQDKARAVALVNDVREKLYDYSPLGWNLTLCVPVRQLCGECGDCGTYNGISLPNYVEQVLSAWVGRRPVPIVDKWVIYPEDGEWHQAQGLQLVDMGTDYPFLNDPPCGQCVRIGFLAKNPLDKGKVLTVRYIDNHDIRRTEGVTLGGSPVCLTYLVKAVERSGVSLPVGLAGAVVARTDGGLTLAEWAPWELVPGYRRFKLAATVCGCIPMLAIHGERRRGTVNDLAEPVETDQKHIWQDGARYLYLHEKTNADALDQANSVRFLGSFRGALDEEARRRMGRMHRNALRFQGSIPRGSRLLRAR